MQTLDFILDASFRDWVLKKTPNRDWDNYAGVYPEQQKAIEQAIIMVQLLEKQRVVLDEATLQQRFERLQQQLLVEEKMPKIVPLSPLTWLWRVAALLILGLGLGYLYRQNNVFSEDKTMTTLRVDQGKRATVKLPDSSLVVLEGPASLTFQKTWTEKSFRKVALEGKAFFEVTKTPRALHPTFEVKTGDMIVTVLGTSFTVNQKDTITSVVLNTGKVQLSNTNNPQTMLMQPGDKVDFNKNNNIFTKKQVNTSLYTAWLNKKWTLKNTSLQDIADWMHDTYNIEVQIKNKATEKLTASGTFADTDFEYVTTVLAKLYGVEMVKEKNRLTIK
jgi:ferric-dicitrate binding protein FerR (iron transport regulator)